MKILWDISRIIVGLVFAFSGFVKCIDPLGTAYKIEDYLLAFGMEPLSFLALFVSVVQSVLEFCLGVCMLCKWRLKEASLGILIFMVIYTPLTLYIALTNPVTDCGCFGDAIVLTNTQTFIKNLIILTLTIYFISQKTNYQHTKTYHWYYTLLTSFAGVLICIYCLRHLPIIDFRPYKIGANINDLMIAPEGMPHDEIETILIYEKDGVQKEFSEQDYPWADTTWHWVDSYNKVKAKRIEPTINDFEIIDQDGFDHTLVFLEEENYAYMIVSWDINQIDNSAIEALNKVKERCMINGYSLYFITGSSWNDIDNFKLIRQWEDDIYYMDAIQLKTIIRANPGIVLTKNGIVIDKWSYRDF